MATFTVNTSNCPAFIAGLICTAVTLMEFFQSYKYRTLRAGVFVALGVPSLSPFLPFLPADNTDPIIGV